MKLETKRLLLFGVLITMTTSFYVTFLGTYLTYGFRPGFLAKWLGSVPRAYLVVLPYILLMGPLVQRLVRRLLPDLPASYPATGLTKACTKPSPIARSDGAAS